MDKVQTNMIAHSGVNPDLARMISAVRFKFRDEFGWPAGELADRYDTTGSTVQPTVGANLLTISSGTAANAVCQARLPLAFTAPAQVVVGMQFSQANPANCDVSLELVDGTGQVCAAFVFPAGSTATQTRIHTFNKYRTAAWENTNVWYTASDRVASARLYSIQLFPDEIRFAQRDVNSNSGRNTLAIRTFRVPDPDEPLSLRVRMVNGATGPATSTDLRVWSVNVTDINELPVDLTNTGGSSAGETIPVNVVTSTPVQATPLPNVSVGSYSTTARTVTAATTNATLTKNTAANVGGGSITNTSATAMWFKMFNMSTAPTVGTSQPVLTIPVPANSTTSLTQYIPAQGLRLGTGVSWCLTAAPAHTDTAAVAAGSIVELLYV